jgi:outer membrane protein assembly factor BamB
MTKSNERNSPETKKSLRILPGLIITAIQAILAFLVPALMPGAMIVGVLGGMALGLVVLVWWLVFSRAQRIDKWVSLVFIALFMVFVPRFLHESISTGNMGLMYSIYAIPAVSVALVIWALLFNSKTIPVRMASLAFFMVFASGIWLLFKSEGLDGDGRAQFSWRWKPDAEELFVADNSTEMKTILADSSVNNLTIEWQGYRGKNRNSIVHGVRINTNWQISPPIELWRRQVGPGCSSFAVLGQYIYTQEQRGENEIVSCYNLHTGKPVWLHSYKARFWDSHAGAGPRSTPYLEGNRVYAIGATGIIHALDAYTGELIWARNAAADTKVDIPGWGYTSSPIVVDSVVIVAISSQALAYHVNNGQLLWTGNANGESYSSPQLVVIDGVKQVLLPNKKGLYSYSPSDGKTLWKIEQEGVRIIQAAEIANGEMLIDIGDLNGLRLVSVKNKSGHYVIEEKWTTNKLKPNHNDIIVHNGHAFGMDMPGLECIELKNGERKWKGKKYGGQLLLLSDQNLLLILSEKGELVLVEAYPEQFKELAKFKAIEGKTWNHPALVGDILLVRNSREMAAFRLPALGK